MTDDDQDPLTELMESDKFDDDAWTSVDEQESDIGRDASERDGHPLGDAMNSDGYDEEPSLETDD